MVLEGLKGERRSLNGKIRTLKGDIEEFEQRIARSESPVEEAHAKKRLDSARADLDALAREKGALNAKIKPRQEPFTAERLLYSDLMVTAVMTVLDGAFFSKEKKYYSFRGLGREITTYEDYSDEPDNLTEEERRALRQARKATEEAEAEATRVRLMRVFDLVNKQYGIFVIESPGKNSGDKSVIRPSKFLKKLYRQRVDPFLRKTRRKLR